MCTYRCVRGHQFEPCPVRMQQSIVCILVWSSSIEIDWSISCEPLWCFEQCSCLDRRCFDEIGAEAPLCCRTTNAELYSSCFFMKTSDRCDRERSKICIKITVITHVNTKRYIRDGTHLSTQECHSKLLSSCKNQYLVPGTSTGLHIAYRYQVYMYLEHISRIELAEKNVIRRHKNIMTNA